MAITGNKSGSFNGQYPSYATPYIFWSYEQSIPNNNTVLTVTLKVKREKTGSTTYKASTPYSITIGGTKTSGTMSFRISNASAGEYITIGSASKTISHNSNGSASAVSISASIDLSGTTLGTGSVSTSVTPNTIPRTSSISSVVGNTIGSTVTVNITRQADSFTHNVFYTRFDGAIAQVGTAVGTSCTFTPHIGDCQYLPNSSSGTATITVDTYSGSTKVGSVSQAITLNVPSNIVPSISSVSVSEGNTVIPTSWGVYVQGKSQLKVTITASGAYGSSITTYKTTGIDNNTYWANSFYSSVLQNTGTKTITVKVVDSRGREATKTIDYTCIAYSNPNISVATVTRCNADKTDNEEGEYVKYSFKASIAPVSNKNGSLYQLGYKTNNEDTYTYITIAQNTYLLDKKDTVISGVTFSADNSYDFHFYIGDTFVSTSSYQQLGTGFTLLDFNASGKGMAIGKVSEKDALEINMDIYNKDGALIEAFKVSSTEPTNNEKLWIQKGKNLFDKNNVVVGALEGDGSVAYNTTNSTTDFIPVSPNKTYCKTVSSSGRVKLYYKDKTPYSDGNRDITNFSNAITFTIPEDIYYIRFSFSNSTTDTLQLEQGSTATEYEAYVDRKINVDGEEFLDVEKVNNHLKQIEGGKVRVSFSLYENSSGSNGTITLSDSAANYNILEIFYRDNNGNDFNSTRVFGPNGKNVYLSCIEAASTPATNIRTSRYAISGTSMTVSSYTYTQIPNKNNPSVSANNYLYVTKVFGYK